MKTVKSADSKVYKTMRSSDLNLEPNWNAGGNGKKLRNFKKSGGRIAGADPIISDELHSPILENEVLSANTAKEHRAKSEGAVKRVKNTPLVPSILTSEKVETTQMSEYELSVALLELLKKKNILRL
jgi:hypothetical protein